MMPLDQNDLVQAGLDPFTIVAAVGAIGFAIFSRFNIKRASRDSEVNSDDAPPGTATRGDPIPLLIGRDEVGPFVGWEGDRTSFEEKTGSVGGGKGGGSGGKQDITQKVFVGRAFHALVVGPGRALHGITENGAPLYEGTITPSDTPSGSVVTIPGTQDQFEIYWGEGNQPGSEYLKAQTGTMSDWPFVCYIVWRYKRLGTQQTWPDLRYDLTAYCQQPVPEMSDAWVGPDNDQAVNLAAALFQIVCAPFPHGAGRPSSEMDQNGLERLGLVSMNEGVGFNSAMRGETAKDALETMMSEHGFMIAQAGAMLRVAPLRETADPLPVLSESVLVPPKEEVETAQDTRQAASVLFTYRDRSLNYRESDVVITDDGLMNELSNTNPVNVRLRTVRSARQASIVASRRRPEFFSDSPQVRRRALHGARELLPGDPVQFGDLGPARVVAVQPDADGASADVDVILDVYSVPVTSDPFDTPSGGGLSVFPVPDAHVRWLELPVELSGSAISVVVLRVADVEGLSGAFVYGSVEGGAYSLLGEQNTEALGGTLRSQIDAAGPDVIESGFVIEALNDRAGQIADLSSSTTSWQAGTTVLLVGDEIMFVRSVTPQAETAWAAETAYSIGDVVRPTDGNATGKRYVCTVAGTTGEDEPFWPVVRGTEVDDGTATWEAREFAYSVDGAIRARYGTARETHVAGSVVFVVPAAQLTVFTALDFMPGAQLCVKTQPYSPRGSVDLAVVTPVCDTLTGAALGIDLRVTEEGDVRVTEVGDLRVPEA